MRRNVSLTWRRRYLVAGLLALVGAMTFYVAGAFADAGNPITNTINGKIVDTSGNPNDADTRVTVYVRGRWNWLSHNKDCNLDRNGTGVGMIWNDPTEPGFTVTKGSLSAGVGVATVAGGRNVVDEMVHPTDVGDDSAGNGLGLFNSSGIQQSFTDAGDDLTPSPNNFGAWRSGCGREPFSGGDPFGSWGYDKNLKTADCTALGITPRADGSCDSRDDLGQGYKHIYAKRADVTTVCVNFYDVHGSKAGFQGPNGAKEIDVNGNGDNSIQTNAFNVTDGANCINFPFIASTTPVTNVPVGSKIHDSATVGGAGATQQTTLTFHLFGPSDPTCAGTPLANTAAQTVTGNGTAQSNDYDTSPANGGLGAGTYQWTVDLKNLNGDTLDTSGCGKEPSVVNKSPTRTDTTEALKITEKIKVTLTATGTSNIAATGPTRIRLFKGTCVTGSEDNGTTPLFDETHTLNNNAFDVTLDITSPGDFYWFVEYKGDSNTDPSNDDCTETFSVHFPVL